MVNFTKLGVYYQKTKSLFGFLGSQADALTPTRAEQEANERHERFESAVTALVETAPEELLRKAAAAILQAEQQTYCASASEYYDRATALAGVAMLQIQMNQAARPGDAVQPSSPTTPVA